MCLFTGSLITQTSLMKSAPTWLCNNSPGMACDPPYKVHAPLLAAIARQTPNIQGSRLTGTAA